MISNELLGSCLIIIGFAALASGVFLASQWNSQKRFIRLKALAALSLFIACCLYLPPVLHNMNAMHQREQQKLEQAYLQTQATAKARFGHLATSLDELNSVSGTVAKFTRGCNYEKNGNELTFSVNSFTHTVTMKQRCFTGDRHVTVAR